jgi:hypothetical protein
MGGIQVSRREDNSPHVRKPRTVGKGCIEKRRTLFYVNIALIRMLDKILLGTILDELQTDGELFGDRDVDTAFGTVSKLAFT